MENIRNKIITISGEPVSGKTTLVKEIKEKYEKMGYTVHVISVGNVFRELSKKEYLKMYPDRENANLADIQLDEQFAPKRSKIDELVDQEIHRKGIEINEQERPNDVYIVDSRLAWKNIPESYSVRLTVNENIAGERVFNDNTRGSEDVYTKLEDAVEKTRQRKKSEIARYKQKYNIDLTNPENYDLIIDTSYANVEDVAEILIAGEENYRNGKFYPKNWASPTYFLPLQLGRITGSPTFWGNTIESLAEDIKKYGYDPIAGILEIVELNGNKFLLEGNHRTFGALSAGKTLLPYEVTHKDDKIAKDRTDIITSKSYLEYLYDYAEGIEYYGGKLGNIKQLKNFSIKKLLSIKNLEIAQQYIFGADGR